MRGMAFVGYKKSGKTTTVEAVARILKRRGYRVAVAKSMHSGFDREGSDTWRFSRVADEVLVRASDTEGHLFRTKDVNSLLSVVSADFLLLEGFKDLESVPRIVCARKPEEVRELSHGLAVAVSGVISNELTEVEGLPVINALLESEKLADIVEKRAFMLPNINCRLCGLTCPEMAREIVAGNRSIRDCVILSSKPKVSVRIDGKPLPMKDWVQELVEKTILGMLSAMKGYREGRKIEIKIERER